MKTKGRQFGDNAGHSEKNLQWNPGEGTSQDQQRKTGTGGDKEVSREAGGKQLRRKDADGR